MAETTKQYKLARFQEYMYIKAPGWWKDYLRMDNFFPSEAKRVSLPHGETRRSLMALMLLGSCISSFSWGQIKLICETRVHTN